MTRNEKIDAVCLEWGAALDALRTCQTNEQRDVKKRAETAHKSLQAVIEEVFGPIPESLQEPPK